MHGAHERLEMFFSLSKEKIPNRHISFLNSEIETEESVQNCWLESEAHFDIDRSLQQHPETHQLRYKRQTSV